MQTAAFCLARLGRACTIFVECQGARLGRKGLYLGRGGATRRVVLARDRSTTSERHGRSSRCALLIYKKDILERFEAPRILISHSHPASDPCPKSHIPSVANQLSYQHSPPRRLTLVAWIKILASSSVLDGESFPACSSMRSEPLSIAST